MVERPWGQFTVIYAEPGFQIKKIEVNPGQRLSLQLHRERDEHWVVVKGKAQVIVGTETRALVCNDNVFIPRNSPHRLSNPEKEPLCLIEVQVGSVLLEEDIERLEDDYGRI